MKTWRPHKGSGKRGNRGPQGTDVAAGRSPAQVRVGAQADRVLRLPGAAHRLEGRLTARRTKISCMWKFDSTTPKLLELESRRKSVKCDGENVRFPNKFESTNHDSRILGLEIDRIPVTAKKSFLRRRGHVGR